MKERFYLLRATDPGGNVRSHVVPYLPGMDRAALGKTRLLWGRLVQKGCRFVALEKREAEDDDNETLGDLLETLSESALGEVSAPAQSTPSLHPAAHHAPGQFMPPPGQDIVSFVNSLDPEAIEKRIVELDREREALCVLRAAALARRPAGKLARPAMAVSVSQGVVHAETNGDGQDDSDLIDGVADDIGEGDEPETSEGEE